MGITIFVLSRNVPLVSVKAIITQYTAYIWPIAIGQYGSDCISIDKNGHVNWHIQLGTVGSPTTRHIAVNAI